MATPAFTIQAFGTYLPGLGAILIVAPDVLLSQFGLPPTEEIWIHVVGVLVAAEAIWTWRALRAGRQ